jgi:cytochrome c biogenesis protein CcmG, thiol:disulfide interchange protein DsbE
MKKVIPAIVLILGALGYSWYSKKTLESQFLTESDQILSRIPETSFQTLEGDTVTHQDILDSKPAAIFLHFWATWCGPCEAELPELIEFLNSQTADAALVFVAVNDDIPKMKKFLSTLKPLKSTRVYWLLDNDQSHRDLFGTTKLPESYLFRPNGELLRKFVGPQEWLKPHFFDMFRPFSQPQ